MFDESNETFAAERAELKGIWSESEWAAARRTVLNAHYTDPSFVRAMWSGVRALGFEAGEVLEPGSGSGNFIAEAPAGARMTGIELDPTTAQISQLLHSSATIVNESFADTRLVGDGFDATIGNVPFGSWSLHDPIHNPDKFNVHNHFIVKSLELTKPGGLVAVLTSRFTLDSSTSNARRRMHELGDLVGAVRLPAKAHEATAGTDAITDLVIFRRRKDSEQAPAADWLEVRTVPTATGDVTVNEHFLHHPERVIGKLGQRSGAYGPELTVTAQPGTHERFAAVVAAVAADGVATGLGWAAAGERAPVIKGSERRATRDGHAIGHIGFEDGELFAQGITGREALGLPVAIGREIGALVRVRDAAVVLLDAEQDSTYPAAALEALRGKLNTVYDAYADQYGAINRVTLKPSTSGDDSVRRIYPRAVKFMREDPHYATLSALEHFDEETGESTKAAIFGGRVVGAVAEVVSVESIEEALAVSMDREAHVNVGLVARLMDVPEHEAMDLMRGHVFRSPGRASTVAGYLVPTAEYLSGNVRRKLADAKAHLVENPELAENVAALEAVIPTPLTAGEIDVKIGASWIPKEDVRLFATAVMGKEVDVEVIDSRWKMKVRGNVSESVKARYGTVDFTPAQLLTRLLNHDSITVTRENEDGTRYVDVVATEAALEKAQEVEDHFQDWLWQDLERTDRLLERYNDLFNGIVLRSYDGVELTFPGKAVDFNPRPHQHAAVARAIAEPSVGLFHEVGAGKTAEMVMLTQKLRQLGLAKKPAIVVPNHMLGQFTREFKQIFPTAKVLSAGSEDVAKSGDRDGRRLFVAKATTGDWDAIIMTKSSFARIGLGSEVEGEFQRGELESLRAVLEQMKGSELSRLTTKGIEKKIAAEEERLKETMDMPRDPGVTFEATGIDYLCVDEAHAYKNLRTLSRWPDLQKATSSNLAADLDMKLWYLRKVKDRKHVTALATATPIANTMVEMYIMLRYLRPDLLEEAGIASADDWARQFTEEVTGIEADVIGGSYRIKTRVAKFRNVPELLKLWHTAGDIKTAEDLKLPVPLIVPRSEDGQRVPQVVTVPATAATREYIQDLADRAEAVRSGRVDPTVDNMLKISNDGRSAGMDLRLINPDWTPEAEDPIKVSAVADEVMRIHERTKNNEYRDEHGNASPIRGGLQLVFADRGTPKEAWNFYDALRVELIDRGMPPTKIRFIQDAGNDLQKAALFRSAREGHVSVILGSTEKMGTGTNIQLRATASHDVDCPWRPADVKQRTGRTIRQFNQNAEVEILRYVTEGSFDAYMWQTVSRKGRFIDQVSRGSLDVREVDDISADSLSYAEVSALAAGDMRLLERAELDSQIKKLERSERAWRRERSMNQLRLDSSRGLAKRLDTEVPVIAMALEKRTSTSGDAFAAVYRGGNIRHPESVRSRDQLGELVRSALERYRDSTYEYPGMRDRRIPIEISIGNVPVTFTESVSLGKRHVTIAVDKIPSSEITMTLQSAIESTPGGLAQRIENRVSGLDELQRRTHDRRQELGEEIDSLDVVVRSPFAKAEAMAELQRRRGELVAEMTAEVKGQVASPGLPKAMTDTPVQALGKLPTI